MGRVRRRFICHSREVRPVPSRYLCGRIKAGTHGLNAVERSYERLWSMAYRTWQIEHRGEFRLALRLAIEVTSVTTCHTRHLYDGVLLVLYVAALVASGS